MKALAEILELDGLGPAAKQQLIAAQGVINVAKNAVTELEELRAKRAAMQPAQSVSARSNPADVAKGAALAGAVAEVVGAIDGELTVATAAVRTAENRYRALTRNLLAKHQKLIELESEWGALGAQIEKLRAELAQ